MEVRLKRSLKFLVAVVTLEVLLLLSSCDGGKKENEAIKKKCETCKKLTENFKEGMERTSRYMYDGGDAEWEEKKLGSYATSEMRFIEVTERLCESKEHDCHNMFEDKEETLEVWWKEHQETHPDLYQWFCIDNSKVCCPENKFGPDCEVCPYGLERPCKDNGKCLGAGTRAGTGTCKCKAGYKGELCDICKDGYYQEMKNETHTSCKVCHKACTALCTGHGPKGCKKCKAGWLWFDETGCQDVDECKSEELPCKGKEFCQNTQGSYKCVECDSACDQCIGEGAEQCIKCKTGYELKDDWACKDVNECDQEGACHIDHMTCHNVPGSFYCDCSEGYERVGNECIDKKIFEANNETDQTSGESSEKLESTTSREGEVDATGTDGGIVSNGSAAPDENSGDRNAGNEQIPEETSKNIDDNLETGGEIPNSLDDSKDVSSRNSENSNDSGAFPDKISDTVIYESDLDIDIPTSHTTREEL